MSKYKYLLFDLDHTLWDYDTNTDETIRDIHLHYQLEEKGVAFDHFLSTFFEVNSQLWKLYNQSLITKDLIRKERFQKILENFSITDHHLTLSMSEMFLELGPTKKNLIPGAMDLLNSLFRKIPMAILTNGFDKTQQIKLEKSGIDHFFERMVTSETIGFTKPNKEIFAHLCDDLPCLQSEILMIGDNIDTDIKGAINYGIDSVLFDPHGKFMKHPATYRISHLNEMDTILYQG